MKSTTRIPTTLFLLLCSFIRVFSQNKDYSYYEEIAVKEHHPEGIPKTSYNQHNQNSNPRIFVVLDITVHDSVMYEQYRIKIEPLIKKYGGSYLVRSGGVAYDSNPDRKVIPIKGDWNPDRLIIIQWKSMEDLQAFTNSVEYKNVAVIREKSASTKSLIVNEYQKE